MTILTDDELKAVRLRVTNRFSLTYEDADALLRHIDALQEQLAAASKDAARYRWIRSQSWVFCELERHTDAEYETTDEAFVDAAIDAAKEPTPLPGEGE